MASPLEQFVNNVRSLYLEGSYREIAELVKKSSEILTKNVQHLDNVLDTLLMADHSIAVCGVLIAKYSQTNPTAEQRDVLFNQVVNFIKKSSVIEIAHATEQFAELCHLFTDSLVAQKTPMRGIQSLCTAIDKLRTTPSALTSVHADLCQLCLLAMCFKPALPYLDVDINVITNEGVQFETKYFLLYYYYGGMIYTALKRYNEALYMFEVAVTTPARAVSHIMLEAHKKMLLVSVILSGKHPVLPKYTSQVVNRFIKPLSIPYIELANTCQLNNTEMARALVVKYESTFAREKNLGLANQVIAGLYKNNIQRLTKTFLTLSLADVAARVHLPTVQDAERHILNMIEDGEIFATVNRKDGMVVFHDDPEKYNSPRMLKRLEDEVNSCIELDRKIQSMEEKISVSTIFVQKCNSQEEDSSVKLCPYSM